MKYIANQNFDKIDDEEKVILFTENVDNVYILNEIETQIWRLFSDFSDMNEAYVKFGALINQVKVTKEDFCDFVEQLIEKGVLISSND